MIQTPKIWRWLSFVIGVLALELLLKQALVSITATTSSRQLGNLIESTTSIQKETLLITWQRHGWHYPEFELAEKVILSR